MNSRPCVPAFHDFATEPTQMANPQGVPMPAAGFPLVQPPVSVSAQNAAPPTVFEVAPPHAFHNSFEYQYQYVRHVGSVEGTMAYSPPPPMPMVSDTISPAVSSIPCTRTPLQETMAPPFLHQEFPLRTLTIHASTPMQPAIHQSVELRLFPGQPPTVSIRTVAFPASGLPEIASAQFVFVPNHPIPIPLPRLNYIAPTVTTATTAIIHPGSRGNAAHEIETTATFLRTIHTQAHNQLVAQMESLSAANSRRPRMPYSMETAEFVRRYEEFIQQSLEYGPRGPDPAPQNLIERLPVRVVEEELGKALLDKACAICQDDMKLESVVTQLPCGHIYHKDCVFPWLSIHNTCPVCRSALGSS